MDGASPVTSPPALARAPISAVRPAPELSVVVPTFNERANIPILVERLAAGSRPAATGRCCSSTTIRRTARRRVARALGASDGRVRCMRRIGRRGLAGACLEGMLASQARYVAVMDADLQHDERLLIAMLDRLRSGGCDLVVASRYLGGGSAAGLSKQRARASRFANFLVRRLLGIDLTDPMSGHFMIRRDAFEPLAPSISSQGFKILLDILATKPGSCASSSCRRRFHERRHGESKLDSKVALDFAALLTAKLTNDAVSARFLLFCLVGLTGLVVHLGMLSVATAARRHARSAPPRRSPPSARSPGISSSTTCSPTATSGSPAGASSPA